MGLQTGYLVLKSNGKVLGASWGFWGCEPTRMGNTIIEFILSLTPAEMEEMKRKVKKLEWIPDKLPHLESDMKFVRMLFNLPQLPDAPTDCPFPFETWLALSTLACVEKYDVLIPFRIPEHLLYRIMDGQRLVDHHETWRREKVDWTWTVDFDRGTMMGQKRVCLGWVIPFEELEVGCFDNGLEALPNKDWIHFGSVGSKRCRQVGAEEEGCGDEGCGDASDAAVVPTTSL